MKKNLRGSQPNRSILFCAILTFTFAAAGLAAQKKNAASAGASVFAQDKGKLTIKLNGETVGHEDFEISPSGAGWLARGNADIKPSQGASSKVNGSLALQPNGSPVSYEWTSHAEKTNSARILFDNGIAKMTLQMQGASPFDQTFTFGTPLVAVLDNNLYHQYAVLACLYDWSKRGPQTFSVFIPQEMMPGTVTAESTGSATLDGKPYEGFRVSTTDLEVNLYLDANHRLMRLEVPAAKVSVLRD
jgi:hypothetical protein